MRVCIAYGVSYAHLFKVTCMGRLSMREMMPKMTSSILVKMKALMALVSFWIFLSLFGGPDGLKKTMKGKM